jgi:hypothetical protein
MPSTIIEAALRGDGAPARTVSTVGVPMPVVAVKVAGPQQLIQQIWTHGVYRE